MKDFKPKIKESGIVKHTRFLGLCKSCGLCIEKCPVKCMYFSKEDLGFYETPAADLDVEKCIACGTCEKVCPDCAIKVEKK